VDPQDPVDPQDQVDPQVTFLEVTFLEVLEVLEEHLVSVRRTWENRVNKIRIVNTITAGNPEMVRNVHNMRVMVASLFIYDYFFRYS